MPGISKEDAVIAVQRAPLGGGLLGVYEAISRGTYVTRSDSSEGQQLVTMMAGLRVNGGVSHDRDVALFSNGLFTNIRVRGTGIAGDSEEAEIGLEPAVLFSFEVGTFDRNMRRIGGVDLDQAPFNGRVKRLDSGIYLPGSAERVAYERGLAMFETAFVDGFGSTNKMRVIN